MEHPPQSLEGLRVLVVEDDYFIAVQVEDILRTLKCKAVGPCSSVEAALTACNGGSFDFALLDMNIRGQSILPVVEVLSTMKLPFILATGYQISSSEDPVLQNAIRVAKPFNVNDVGGAMSELLASRRALN